MKKQKTANTFFLQKVINALPGSVAGAIVGVVVVVAGASLHPTSALSLNSARDCDNNAVINCGALSTNEVQVGYSQKGVADIYNYFGISKADIDNINATAVSGLVYKDGTIKVGSTIVATNAITAGRLYIAGSAHVTSGTTSFYTRAPSVSFRSSPLVAYVVLSNNQFKYAILAACGNPVKGTPVPQPTPTPPAPTPMPPTPPTPPAPTPTPPSTQTPPSTPTPPPTELPSTGPAEVFTVLAFAIIGGYIFHMTHRHVKNVKHIRGS